MLTEIIRKQFTRLTTAVALVAMPLTFSSSAAAPKSIDSEEAAIAKAAAFIGLDSEIVGGVRSPFRAELSQLRTDTSLLAALDKAQASVWQVSFPAEMLIEPLRDLPARQFNVLLDSTTGAFLKAWTSEVGEPRGEASQPPAEIAVSDASFRHGLITTPPKATMSDALGKIPWGGAHRYAQNIVVDLTWGKPRDSLIHIWSIALVGLPREDPIEILRGPIYDMLIEVDAHTCSVIGFGDLSHPPAK